jgi:hypothetical protein
VQFQSLNCPLGQSVALLLPSPVTGLRTKSSSLKEDFLKIGFHKLWHHT